MVSIAVFWQFEFSCKKFISNALTLFCRKFGNVVNDAFLVLLFWAKNAVGATFFAFCNYGWHGLGRGGPPLHSPVDSNTVYCRERFKPQYLLYEE